MKADHTAHGFHSPVEYLFGYLERVLTTLTP
nr:MAG TPA: hypothetical protein [Caudoviricetes sp.]